MKVKDIVKKFMFVHDQTNKNLPDALANNFCRKKDQHNHKKRDSQNVFIDVPVNNNLLIKGVKLNPTMRRTQFIAAIKKFLAEGM